MFPLTSKCLKSRFHFIIGQFAPLGHLQNFHCFRHGGVPLVHADLLPVLFLLQPIVGTVILYADRTTVGLALRFFTVCSYLPAGTLRLAGGNIVAVAGVVSGGEQKIFSAVVAPPRGVTRRLGKILYGGNPSGSGKSLSPLQKVRSYHPAASWEQSLPLSESSA